MLKTLSYFYCLTILFFISALAHVVENTAFFGDILLRIPDIAHKVRVLLYILLIAMFFLYGKDIYGY